MTLNDYLLDHDSVDWNESLQTWGWLLPQRFTLWMANRFGDCFIVLDDGSVEMLDVSAGRIEKLANSRDEFAEKLDLDDNAELWLMIPLVNQLVAAGVTLTPDKCYGFRKPTVIGGEYAVSNRRDADSAVPPWLRQASRAVEGRGRRRTSRPAHRFWRSRRNLMGVVKSANSPPHGDHRHHGHGGAAETAGRSALSRRTWWAILCPDDQRRE